jgi:hypothetical protein
MLNTPRAIVLGAAILLVAAISHAMLPRYDVRHMAGDNRWAYERVDRWTGNIELAPRGGASWMSDAANPRRVTRDHHRNDHGTGRGRDSVPGAVPAAGETGAQGTL